MTKTVSEITVVLQSGPTLLSKLMLRFWPIGLMVAPFIRFMPASWLVWTKAVEVKV